MEQIDPATIALDLFNRLLPESLSSRVPTLPRLNSLRKTFSRKSSHQNAPAPPPPSRQPSSPTTITPTANARGKLPESVPSFGSASDTLASDSETDMISFLSTSSRGSSKNGSVSGFDYALASPPPPPPPHQQLRPFLSPPGVEDQQLRLLQVAGKPRRPEDRLDPGFGAHSYDGVDCRWSPSGIKWRYARQGAHLTSSASLEQDDPSFERRSYIDGVAYYLRGCPDTLSELETDILLRSAPWLAGAQRPAPVAAPRQTSDRGTTFLHQAVRLYIVSAVIVAHTLWCWLVAIGHLGWRCEVQYSISSQIIARGHTIANAFGKHGVGLSARIQQFCEGRAGQLIGGFAGWVVESLAGGIQDGYSDGIGMIQGRNSGEQAA